MREANPTIEALRFFCLTPDEHGEPRLRLPTIDLDDPADYFLTDQWPRLERRKDRAIWAAAHRPTAISKAVGQPGKAGAGSVEEPGMAAGAS